MAHDGPATTVYEKGRETVGPSRASRQIGEGANCSPGDLLRRRGQPPTRHVKSIRNAVTVKTLWPSCLAVVSLVDFPPRLPLRSETHAHAISLFARSGLSTTRHGGPVSSLPESQ